MVKLKFVHVSENAFFSQEGKLNVIGVFDRISSVNFPALQPAFSISIGLSGEKGMHKISMALISPTEKKPIVTIGGDLEIKDDNGGAHFVANLVGLPFPEPGKYVIKVEIDGNFVDESNSINVEKINGPST